MKALTYEEKNARREEKFEYASWEDAVYSGGLFNGKGKVSSRIRREEKLFARGSSEVRMSNEVASSISVRDTPCMRGE